MDIILLLKLMLFAFILPGNKITLRFQSHKRAVAEKTAEDTLTQTTNKQTDAQENHILKQLQMLINLI